MGTLKGCNVLRVMGTLSPFSKLNRNTIQSNSLFLVCPNHTASMLCMNAGETSFFEGGWGQVPRRG